ncbi:MAG: Threonylcarbamoyladenosine tRNA methylthiotransferase MtaB [Candidatus Heimdallarchaeota archaeon LC_3]|nr:MAG: Threonylcarbamoyladenosine tRNA methylthiotransferase MtaB [Candidatus Heimdallarchaeota archaeon LC_3]
MDEKSIFSKINNRNSRILLIHPSFKYTGTDNFPLGLGYVAAILKKQGYQNITVVDEQKYQIGKDQIERIFKPEIVGISLTSPSFPRTKNILKSIKKIRQNKQPLIILGGVHPTFRIEECLEAGGDIIVRGEADNTLLQLFSGVIKSLDEVNGISFFDHDNFMIKHNSDTEQITDLDTVPFPARELFKKENYSVMSTTTSRGCPYNCNYCSATTYWNNRVRYHSVEYVVNELASIADLGYKLVIFEDATFSVNFKRTEAICQELIENERIKSLVWSCETRPDRLNSDLLNLFDQSRCIMINLGVESASDEVLRINNRNVKLENVIDAIQTGKKLRSTIQVMMIFGLPGENQQSVKETINFLETYKPDRVLLSLATAYPGTELDHTTNRIDLPLEWRKKFVGHGGDQHSPLYFPENMLKEEYITLAEKLLETVNKVNKINHSMFRKRQDRVIKESYLE